MTSDQVKEITKIAAELTSGDSLSIEVPSKAQGVSFRTMFYKERRSLLKQGITLNASVTSIEVNEYAEWIVTISYTEQPKIVLRKADGSVSDVALDPGIEPLPARDIPDDIKNILEKHRSKIDPT